MTIFTSPKSPQKSPQKAPKKAPKKPHFLASRFFGIFQIKVDFIFSRFKFFGIFRNVNSFFQMRFLRSGFFLFQGWKKGDCAEIPAHSPPKTFLHRTTICGKLL